MASLSVKAKIDLLFAIEELIINFFETTKKNLPEIAKESLDLMSSLIRMLGSIKTFDYDKSIVSKFDEEFYELLQIFSDLKKLKNYDDNTLKPLYRQIKLIHSLFPQNITFDNLDQQIFGIKKNISDLQQKVENLAPINYLKEKKELKEGLKYIDNKKKEFDALVGDIAENKNAIKYTNFAKENKTAARWLFWISIVVMCAVAGFSLYLFWNFPIKPEDVKILWLRLPMLLLILMPAFFMMRESKKLKDKEFQYYDIACRIITSAPYIDGLSISPEEKGKLKADLVKDFFARPIECMEDGGLTPMSEVAKAIKNCADLKK